MNPMERLVVVAEIAGKSGKENDLRRELMALIEPTRKENGCVEYNLHTCTEEPGRFIFYEVWVSREALNRHMQTPHFKKFVEATKDLLEQPPRILTCTRIV